MEEAKQSETTTKAPEWVPDEEVMECQGCLRPFTVTFRRHHCRGCGKIFCKVCSKQKCLLPPSFGFQDGPERVCDKCAKYFFPYEPLMAVTPNGGKIEFGRVGTGSQIVLCFHGAPGNYSQGISQAYMLFETQELKNTYTIIAPTRPGYGETPLEMGTTPKDQANMAIQLLDELGIPRSRTVIVIALSAGGPVAIEFCMNFPRRVASAIFLSCVTHKYWPGQAKGLAPEEVEGEQSFLTKAFLKSPTIHKAGVWVLKKLSVSYPSGTKTALRSSLSESSLWEPEIIEKHIDRIIENSENVWAFQTLLFSLGGFEGLENDLQSLRTLPDYKFENIEVPTFFIHGRNDGDVSLNHAESASQRIPNSKLLALEDTDHLVWLGPQYQKTKDEVLMFVQHHPSTVDESFNEASGIVMAIPPPDSVESKKSTSVADLALSPTSFNRESRHKKQLQRAQVKLDKVEDEFYDL